MKPYNMKERKSSLMKYSGSLILVMVPLLLAVYMFTKVDKVENHWLRDKYGEWNPLINQKGEENTNVAKLNTEAQQMDTLVTWTYKSEMKLFNPKTSKSGEIDRLIESLDSKVSNVPKSESLYKTTFHLASVIQTLSEVYATAVSDIAAKDKTIEDSKKAWRSEVGTEPPW